MSRAPPLGVEPSTRMKASPMTLALVYEPKLSGQHLGHRSKRDVQLEDGPAVAGRSSEMNAVISTTSNAATMPMTEVRAYRALKLSMKPKRCRGPHGPVGAMPTGPCPTEVGLEPAGVSGAPGLPAVPVVKLQRQGVLGGGRRLIGPAAVPIRVPGDRDDPIGPGRS